MDTIFLIIGLIILAVIFLPWINMARIGGQRRELNELMRRLSELEDRVGYKRKPYKAFSNSRVEKEEKEEIEQDFQENFDDSQELEDPFLYSAVLEDEQEAEVRENPFKRHVEESKEKEQSYDDPYVYGSERNLTKITDWLSRGFEMNIAAKLPVWIGALSLIFGVVFLVKYSIEMGLLVPFVRVCLGAFAGSLMVGAGQWISKRDYIANATRIAQGLIGAGLVALYASVYAAVSLYGFFPPIIGFVGMTVVSAMAVIFSLRHGQPIAIFGLIGGFLTPALVGGEPNTLALFGYLFVFFAFMFNIMMRKGWWMISIASLIAGFGWPFLWLAAFFNPAETSIVLLFVIGLAGIVIGATHRAVKQDGVSINSIYPHLLNVIAIIGCILTIFWIDYKITLSLFDWSMMGLLGASSFALAYFKPEIYQKPLFVQALATFVLFALWIGKVSFVIAMPVVAGLFALYAIGSGWMLRQQQITDPKPWGLLQTISAGMIYILCYLLLDVPNMSISEDTLFGFIALGLSIAAIDQAAKWRKNNHVHMAAIYVLTASAFIATGFIIMLPWGYAAMAISGQLLATAWVYRQTSIAVLNPILYFLTIGFLALNIDQIFLFMDVISNAVFDETMRDSFARRYMLDMPIIQLGLPLLCFGGSVHFLSANTKRFEDKTLVIFLTKIFVVLAVALTYCGIRFLLDMQNPLYLSGEGSFVARGVMTISCFGIGYGVLKYAERTKLNFLKPVAMFVFAFVAARFVWFDFIIDNPYLDGAQKVGELPIINAITLTYGAATAFAIWMINNNFSFKIPKAYLILAAASFLAMISLHVRHFFNGDDLVQGATSMEEFYTYSVAWLLSGLLCLSIGIHKNIGALRLAAMALIGATICKVFLLDAAELDGLYRVFSFIGLGASLIGLSFFYTKFMIKNDREKVA